MGHGYNAPISSSNRLPWKDFWVLTVLGLRASSPLHMLVVHCSFKSRVWVDHHPTDDIMSHTLLTSTSTTSSNVMHQSRPPCDVDLASTCAAARVHA